ncbi:hypothetical protein [Pseudoalteromonas piratica]|uniref:Uncharacterized protein n=1 Tax=Pseudoalteromonas piratica TaxID=1348114 RepID=A0A0A7EKW4_9GAMM|nr:hypothetical protein [Pseudoalteromonas piratica]AIY66706.1 hypothetical protein OM33_16395 [Pseudoalteromonas piratica]
MKIEITGEHLEKLLVKPRTHHNVLSDEIIEIARKKKLKTKLSKVELDTVFETPANFEFVFQQSLTVSALTRKAADTGSQADCLIVSDAHCIIYLEPMGEGGNRLLLTFMPIDDYFFGKTVYVYYIVKPTSHSAELAEPLSGVLLQFEVNSMEQICEEVEFVSFPNSIAEGNFSNILNFFDFEVLSNNQG